MVSWPSISLIGIELLLLILKVMASLLCTSNSYHNIILVCIIIGVFAAPGSCQLSNSNQDRMTSNVSTTPAQAETTSDSDSMSTSASINSTATMTETTLASSKILNKHACMELSLIFSLFPCMQLIAHACMHTAHIILFTCVHTHT